MRSSTAGPAVPTNTNGAVSGPAGNCDGATGMADCSTKSVVPAPKAGSPISRTSHDIGSQKGAFGSWVSVCTRTSAIPAFRNSPTAQSTVRALDGNPETRPHSWPVPNSFVVRLSLENATIRSRSARMTAPVSSCAVGSPAGSTMGRGIRLPTMTAGSAPGGGGGIRPSQGPSVRRAAGFASGSWATTLRADAPSAARIRRHAADCRRAIAIAIFVLFSLISFISSLSRVDLRMRKLLSKGTRQSCGTWTSAGHLTARPTALVSARRVRASSQPRPFAARRRGARRPRATRAPRKISGSRLARLVDRQLRVV